MKGAFSTHEVVYVLDTEVPKINLFQPVTCISEPGMIALHEQHPGGLFHHVFAEVDGGEQAQPQRTIGDYEAFKIGRNKRAQYFTDILSAVF